MSYHRLHNSLFTSNLKLFHYYNVQKHTLNFVHFTKSGNFAADYQTITQSCYQNNLINHKSYSTMKQGIHPENYRPVVFKDMSNGDMFLSRSTCKTTDTVEFEGETYPVVKLEISSTSHPFYTGKSKLVDTAGRVDKFMSRYGKSRK